MQLAALQVDILPAETAKLGRAETGEYRSND